MDNKANKKCDGDCNELEHGLCALIGTHTKKTKNGFEDGILGHPYYPTDDRTTPKAYLR